MTLDRARDLIAEAGAMGAELTFYVPEGGSGMLDPVAMGAAIQADLAAVGFDVAFETYEWNTFLGEVNPGPEGKADMAEMAWMTNDPDTLPSLALRTGRRRAGSNPATTPTRKWTGGWRRGASPPTRRSAGGSTSGCRRSFSRTVLGLRGQRNGGWKARLFQLDGLKFHGSRSSMRFWGCPEAMASSVALR